MSIQYTAEQLQRKFPGPAGAPGFPRLADGLRAEGRTDEAIELCREGLRLRPGALTGYLILGKTLMESGRLEEAQEQFEAALRLDPRCLSAMQSLGRIMAQSQWSDAAAGYYRSILEVEPWDAEIRALLDASGHSGDGLEPSDSSTARQKFAPIVDFPSDGKEETYEKPEGFSGDVLEVSLNDLAEDFLPGDGAEMQTAEDILEESLEDALASPKEEARPSPASATVAIPEPTPQDILKEEPLEQIAGAEEGGSPISGADVEERLDSLFGSEETPAASGPSPTSTWTAALAEPEAASETFEITDELPGAKAEDYAGTRAHPLAEESLYRDEPVEAFAETGLAGLSDAAFPGGGAEGDGSRVEGEDIEKRLDELFNLATGETPAFPAPIALPVAPAPRIEEAVSLGESVPFGGDAPLRSADGSEAMAAEATAMESAVSETTFVEAEFPETMAAETAFAEAPVSEAPVLENPVTGQDVADKLDRLFGIEPSGPTAAESAEARDVQVRERDAMIADSGATEAFLKSDIEDMEMPAIDLSAPIPVAEAPVPVAEAPVPIAEVPASDAGPTVPDDANLMTTISMPPSRWSEEMDGGPQVTGDDVEAQLDKLFGLAENGETFKPSPSSRVDASDRGEATQPASVEGGDRTMFMPAFHEPVATGRASEMGGHDGPAIKEGVDEWLARRTEDAETRAAGAAASAAGGAASAGAQTGEAGTSRLSLSGDMDATLEFANPPSKWDAPGETAVDADLFGTLAPEEHSELSETATIEMVDGADVAERLDRLFAVGDGEMSLFPGEGAVPADTYEAKGASVAFPEAQDGEAMISGEDVSSRLSEIFEPASGSGKPEAEAAAFPSQSGAPQAPGFAPMSDEEDGYPEEEELPPGEGPGANVATVTLAEIYFQQGLKEQALQIYRQLLEREPENESVRARIEEIEATKPEDGDRGPGTDQRRPRPGLKVPKRKK